MQTICDKRIATLRRKVLKQDGKSILVTQAPLLELSVGPSLYQKFFPFPLMFKKNNVFW